MYADLLSWLTPVEVVPDRLGAKRILCTNS